MGKGFTLVFILNTNKSYIYVYSKGLHNWQKWEYNCVQFIIHRYKSISLNILNEIIIIMFIQKPQSSICLLIICTISSKYINVLNVKVKHKGQFAPRNVHNRYAMLRYIWNYHKVIHKQSSQAVSAITVSEPKGDYKK